MGNTLGQRKNASVQGCPRVETCPLNKETWSMYKSSNTSIHMECGRLEMGIGMTIDQQNLRDWLQGHRTKTFDHKCTQSKKYRTMLHLSYNLHSTLVSVFQQSNHQIAVLGFGCNSENKNMESSGNKCSNEELTTYLRATGIRVRCDFVAIVFITSQTP